MSNFINVELSVICRLELTDSALDRDKPIGNQNRSSKGASYLDRATGKSIMRLFALAAASGLLLLIGSLAAEARGSHGSGSIGVVRGYVKRDGTVVAAHYRTAPDGRLDNNLGYRGRSPLRGVIPQTVETPAPAAEASLLTGTATVVSEAGPAASEATAMPEEPGIHRHHVSCPNERMVGSTDPYNSFCLIN
jgi:hypothetical protein